MEKVAQAQVIGGTLQKASTSKLDALIEDGALKEIWVSSGCRLTRIKKAKMSQSVFAGFLNVTTSTVQKWQSPASGKHPGGAAAKLLQILEKKGIEALTV